MTDKLSGISLYYLEGEVGHGEGAAAWLLYYNLKEGPNPAKYCLFYHEKVGQSTILRNFMGNPLGNPLGNPPKCVRNSIQVKEYKRIFNKSKQ